MVTYQQLRNEIDEYLVNYEEGFSTQDSLISIASLVRRASPDVQNRALNYAVKVGEPELVKIIIDNGANVNSVIDGQTPMMAAIKDPDSHWDKVRDIIETLLDRGANPSEVVDEKSVDDIINSEINILRADNRETDIRKLENIRDMIDQRKDRIGGKKRIRKRTKKNKNKKRKSSKSKKRKSTRSRKHRK